MQILLVEDHKIVRDGLKRILAAIPTIRKIDEAPNGKECLHKSRGAFYNVIILDIGLPDTSGIEILRVLKQEQPKTKILMLSMYPEEQFAIRAIKSGASGYLTKESASDELIKAIRKISQSGKYVPPSLAEKLAIHLDEHTEMPNHESLSDREFLVLQAIAHGETISQIAKNLQLSIKTISTYKSRVFEKMGFTNNQELIRYALQHKILV